MTQAVMPETLFLLCEIALQKFSPRSGVGMKIQPKSTASALQPCSIEPRQRIHNHSKPSQP
jgi:hypothetical protein